MVIHELKCWPEFFEPLSKGAKTGEIRFNDRNFQVGDVIDFREWSPTLNAEGYTGRKCRRLVSHVLRHDQLADGSLSPDFVLLSLWTVMVNGIEVSGDRT